MADKHYAFVDRNCEKCKGTGIVFKGLNGGSCPECHGTGMTGGLKEVPNIPMNSDKGFGDLLRKAREQRKIGMDELAKEFGWSLVHLSNIETGREKATSAEYFQIMKWIEQG